MYVGYGTRKSLSWLLLLLATYLTFYPFSAWHLLCWVLRTQRLGDFRYKSVRSAQRPRDTKEVQAPGFCRRASCAITQSDLDDLHGPRPMRYLSAASFITSSPSTSTALEKTGRSRKCLPWNQTVHLTKRHFWMFPRNPQSMAESLGHSLWAASGSASQPFPWWCGADGARFAELSEDARFRDFACELRDCYFTRRAQEWRPCERAWEACECFSAVINSEEEDFVRAWNVVSGWVRELIRFIMLRLVWRCCIWRFFGAGVVLILSILGDFLSILGDSLSILGDFLWALRYSLSEKGDSVPHGLAWCRV